MLDYSAVLPALIAFAVTALLGPFLIPLLHRLKFGQPEVKVGLTEHLKKNGTPTMGGILFLLGTVLATAFFIPTHPKIIPVLFLMLGFGVVGFIDDYRKVTKKGSDGISGWLKLGLQVLVFVIYILLVRDFGDATLLIRIPFTHGQMVDIGIFTYPLMFFAICGTANGTNLTDGVDGLLTSVTAVVAVFFLVASHFLYGGMEPLASAVLGGLCGFLLFNAYPAKVFMGDTGSLALGGFVAGMAYAMNLPIFILIVGFIYLLEAVSVILQVGYFKLTHGKRIFRMAPIHHHFEKGGWSETKVVAVFTVITALLCLVGLWGI